MIMHMHTSTQSYECSVGQMNKSKNGGFLLMRVNLLGLPFFLTCVMHLEVDYITKHLKYQQGALGQMPG